MSERDPRAESAARSDPRAEYGRRLELRRAESAKLLRRERIVSNLRLAVFVAGAVAAWFALGIQTISPLWLVPAGAAFVALVVVHDRWIRAREHADRAVAFYERGMARLEDRWRGTGRAGDAFRDPTHPYAGDLDVFGEGSLYERIGAARTRAGEARLAAWLTAPAAPEDVRARQEAVAELSSRLDLREDLAVLGEDVRAELHPEALRSWGEAPPILESRAERALAGAFPALAIAALAAWILGLAPLHPLELALVAQGIFAWRLRSRVLRVVRAADLPGRELALLGRLLARLEAEAFEAAELARLRGIIGTGEVPASQRIATLRRRIELLDSRRNQLFAPIGALLLWTTQLAFAIESWRRECGPALGTWLEAVGELEAYASLAGFAFERPDAVFPDIADAGPVFDAVGLGHPLLPASTCIRNDVALGGDLRVLVVSGSNMSGKSTLLRSVGTNAVLALAGAPVCAKKLRLSPVAVGASIRIQDSLLDGSSRFYAEIRRLRQILELAERRPPALFLLDEILHGTNSHDRGIGAEAVVRGLLAREAIGLVTTHDLALARVADSLAPRAANVHFEDHLEDGRIAFDYRLRGGVVRRSNALALMRAVGIDV